MRGIGVLQFCTVRSPLESDESVLKQEQWVGQALDLVSLFIKGFLAYQI
jgi:hypothetical protein